MGRIAVALACLAFVACGGAMSSADLGLGLDLHPNGSAPPLASVEAEATVAGAFLISPRSKADIEALDRAQALLSPEMFTRSDFRLVYAACAALRSRGTQPDVITVAEHIKAEGEFEKAGGFDTIAGLVDAVPSVANVEYHAQIIRDRAERRRALSALRVGIRDVHDCARPLANLLDEHRVRVERLQGADAAGNLFHLMTEDEVDHLAAPEPLLGDILLRGSLAVISGPPELGKTFLLVDWAMCVARGVSWIGRPVHQGPVVYVYAEGTGGLGARTRAWRDYTQAQGNSHGVRFITRPVQLGDPAETSRFLVDVRRQLTDPPVLVVFDTLSRCMVGGDENSHADMTRFIAGADRVREQTGATVLIAHHPNASGERERGHTSLWGAVDTLMTFNAEGSVRVLRCKKQKDLPHFEHVPLRLKPHAGSAVLTPSRAIGVTGVQVTEQELETLRSLHTSSLEEGLTASQWQEVVGGAGSTFFSHRKSLLDKGLVERDGPQRGARYRVTSKGEGALKEKLQ